MRLGGEVDQAARDTLASMRTPSTTAGVPTASGGRADRPRSRRRSAPPPRSADRPALATARRRAARGGSRASDRSPCARPRP
jgi:hypothetical protein